jgi:hypothetical protein
LPVLCNRLPRAGRDTLYTQTSGFAQAFLSALWKAWESGGDTAFLGT